MWRDHMCACLDSQAFFSRDKKCFKRRDSLNPGSCFSEAATENQGKPSHQSFIWWSPQVAGLAHSWCCAANQVGCRSHRCGAHVDVDEVVCPARGANGARKKSNIQYMSILDYFYRKCMKMQLTSLQGFKRMDISGYLSCVHWSTIYEWMSASNHHTPNCIDLPSMPHQLPTAPTGSCC